jgi:sulfite exporter TauE/SafE
MQQLIVAFITGLTTGGLSCLAVQGGLLASSLGRQVEQDVARQPGPRPGHRHAPRQRAAQPQGPAATGLALPIALFLAAKIVAYTALGLLLGALGSVLQLNALTRAILLIGVGIFMVGNALRMFNVHPFFRIFAIEPPKFITRYIRRKAKGSTDWFTPLFLGALTVFIPCGVTQAMMAVAIGTGSPLQGAALMLAFTLGTSPVFFTVAYLATQIGKRLERWFMRFVAVIMLVLGLLSVDSGLTLMGSPLSVTNMLEAARANSQPVVVPVGADGVILLTAQNNGYSPRQLHVPADRALTLNVVTNGVYSCARGLVIPALNVEQLLPATGTVPIAIPPQSRGTVMPFSCSMGMYTGQIVFDQ